MYPDGKQEREEAESTPKVDSVEEFTTNESIVVSTDVKPKREARYSCFI